MMTYADKSQENRNQSNAESVSHQPEVGSETAQFVNNRPEADAQRRLQTLANNGFKAKQTAQLQAMAATYSSGQSFQLKKNNMGLPDNLKSGIENLSGYSVDDVKVHYNSDKPSQLNAHAYAQGTDIHIAPGQERHLPHEAWHVVQQKQGRVKPTMQLKGKVSVNDDVSLEKEADWMGAKAVQLMENSSRVVDRGELYGVVDGEKSSFAHDARNSKLQGNSAVVQRVIDFTRKSTIVPATNLQELIAFFVNKYGKSNEEFIISKIKKINILKEKWTVYDVYRSFLADKLPIYSEVEFSNHSSKPTLPGGDLSDEGRYASINQFSFNTVTRLVGIVGKNKFETRNDSFDDKHAEEIFMDQVESSGIKLNEDTKIRITINNSPCHAKCSALLAKWVGKHGFNDVTIFFANPYGTDEEFSEAVKILKEAGITVHGFIPLEEIGSDTDDEIMEEYRERFEKMKDRLKYAKGKGLYKSDDESESSDEKSVESEDEKLTYKQWLKEIEILAWIEYGMKLDDLPDEMYMDGYENGYSPIEFYEERMSNGKSVPIDETYTIDGEKELEPVIISSVADFLNRNSVHPGSSIFVVSGKNWECYIRCVLHHFGKINLLQTVLKALNEASIDISDGVVIGTDQEDDIIEILTQHVGAFYVTAIDYNQGITESSRTIEGTNVNIILTGAHFSLLI